MSAELKRHPTDLTVLAKKNNGVFPLNSVYRVIDGRDAIPSHGRVRCLCGDIVLFRRNTSILNVPTTIFTRRRPLRSPWSTPVFWRSLII